MPDLPTQGSQTVLRHEPPLRFPWAGTLAVLRHLGWMALGGLACLVAAVLVGEALPGPTHASWASVGAVLGTAIAVGFAGAAWRGERAAHWFDLAAGAMTALALSLGSATSLAVGLPAVAAPALAVALRRDLATRLASLALLPAGVLAFQAATDLHDTWLAIALAAVAASPALVRLRGAALVAGALALAASAFAAAL